jgi:hypothetical protein
MLIPNTGSLERLSMAWNAIGVAAPRGGAKGDLFCLIGPNPLCVLLHSHLLP